MTPRLSIVIPAHDEGPLVRRTLERMLHGAEPGEFEVVVVANGCTDDTAAQAASVPGVRVVELDGASKTAALNAGDEAAVSFPRAYIDADVSIDAAALRALAETLATDDPVVAAPRMVVDASAASIPVRAYYRVWAQSEYRAAGHVGSGVYAVNRAGRERWGRFPDVIADDRFVQSRFRRSERATVEDHVFAIVASRDMASHIRRGVRIEHGNRQLRSEAQVGDRDPVGGRYGRLLRRVGERPHLWPSFVFYAYGYGMMKLLARADRPTSFAWDRDASLREAVRG
jgi:glycosyltransferase involved in cell wall biosynthesis